MFGHNENLRCHLYCSNAVRTPRLKARGKLSVISFTVRAEARTNAQVLASFDIIGREFSVSTPRTIKTNLSLLYITVHLLRYWEVSK